MLVHEKTLIEELASKLAANNRIIRITAFGSRVRGDFRADSDLDILIVVDRKDREIKNFIIGLVYDYELAEDISISPAVLSLHEVEMNRKLGSPFLKNVEAEGVVLYDADRSGKKGVIGLSA